MVGEAVLPEELLEFAFRTSFGDYAWRRRDLSNVLGALSDRHLAVQGGEVWVVEGNLFCPLPPARTGGLTLLAWQSPEREAHETWDHFAHRTAEETLRSIDALNPEECVPAEVADKLYYHISFSDESAYPPLKPALA
jgi:hypothetical protein